MEFLVEIDYQQIVDLLARCVAVALPIGLIFGLAEKSLQCLYEHGVWKG